MSHRFVLLLPVLLAPMSLAQVPTEGAFLPEGIEATGDTAEVRALTAWAYEQRNTNPEQAQQVAERALGLAQDLNDQRGIGESLLVLGNLASDLDRQEAYYTEAQEAFEQIDYKQGVLQSRLNMGIVFESRGELELALTTYFDVLKGFERLGDTEGKGKARVLNNIGVVHYRQGNQEEALAYYERAIELAESLDNSDLLAGILLNLGNSLTQQGAYETAEIHLRRALAISEEQGFRQGAAIISNNLGFLFNEQGRYRQALPFLLTAEELGNDLENDRLLVAVYDELGKAHLGLGRYDRALYYANESLVLAQEAGSLPRQVEAHQTLSRIYEATGDEGRALDHYRQYAAARDSAFTAEKAEIITEMQTRYETEEKQRAIERLEQETRIQALQLILLLGTVVVALLIASLFYYRYRLKQKANRLLEELDAAKSRFFANISHEFRTPLTVVLGGLQDILAGRFRRDPEKLTEQHHAMLRNSRQLQRLIDEVLDLNRLESGKLDLNPTPGNLVRTLRRIVETDAPLAERNGIKLTFDHDVECCPRLYDQEKLEKIVGNLLSNALKFTPKGGVVRVSLACGQGTEIVVSDDGPGIPVEMQAKVFERFAQVKDGALHGGLSAVPGTAQAGTGIGLALAKELAELHGGTITLESEPGKGSTFTVRLPLEKVSLEAILEENNVAVSESLPSEAIAMSGDDLPKNPVVANDGESESDRTTVLIIEDNDDVRAYVRRSLEETYRVLEAADGEAGLQQTRAELPDLIVSDVMLPGIDGYEIARRLKAESATECIPVVMLTALAAEEDQTEGYGSGAEVYITKPFSPETLRAVCARLLEERRRLRRRLQERMTKETGDGKSINGHPTLRNRVRAIVFENLYDEDFGVEELASAFGMSPRTLRRHVKQEIGISPSDLVRTLRLEHARELLSDGAGSVSEVAYAVGFNSLVAFSRAYSTHYGVSPSSHLGREKNASG